MTAYMNTLSPGVFVLTSSVETIELLNELDKNNYQFWGWGEASIPLNFPNMYGELVPSRAWTPVASS